MQVHDRMTEEVYGQPLTSFATDVVPESVYTIPVMSEGRAALEHINSEMGLAFDEWDLQYYTKLFVETLGRDPTNVELFDMAQSNSEHRYAKVMMLLMSNSRQAALCLDGYHYSVAARFCLW